MLAPKPGRLNFIAAVTIPGFWLTHRPATAYRRDFMHCEAEEG
jgi:hypothetical protein